MYQASVGARPVFSNEDNFGLVRTEHVEGILLTTVLVVVLPVAYLYYAL
jgi:hypothetical protein